MSIFDYFRNLFGAKHRSEPGTSGLGDHYPRRDKFRNPIWEHDEDDDDMDDFRRPRTGMHFHVFSDPIEITRYFETQMDHILKNFMFGFDGFIGALPVEERETLKANTLRDKMLKYGPDLPVITPDQKIDTDLDGKITAEDFSRMWREEHGRTTDPPKPQSFSFGKFMKKEFVRRPDGTLEQKQIIRDSEGNEETIVTREVGGQKYVVTTKTDKNGIETKSEDLINMDENELKDFNKKWTHPIKDNTNGQNLGSFPWYKFFGPEPKL
ncbi:uncharacterized protein LOC116844868 isoform X2 [Odontomachus brunneus]|uniref:uncharacterized protein LOC116844868 isoform X2 n=1 Tax=Odontomachus brunneus TaxID=486640 RepID=UPI0013F1D950|nr:uncharacterized protein LOC116844868 isoform X2 [Odontomachus brunneus]